MQKQPSRKKAFLTQAIGGYILTAIAIVKGLLLLPIYFKFISYEMYGYWITIGSIITLLSIINFGIGTMVTQRISKAYAKKDFKAVGDYFINSLVIYLSIAIVFLGAGFALSHWLQNILGISSEQLRLLETVFYITLFSIMLSFFSNAFKGFSQALLKPLFGVYVMVGANLNGVGLVLFFLYNDFGLLSLPISLLITEIIIIVLCGIYTVVLYKQFGINSKVNTKIIKEYFTFSPHLLKLVVGNKLLENSHPIIITSILGAEITTAYDVTRKVIDIILKMLNVLNASLLSPFSHLVGEGNTTLIKRTTIKIVLLSFLIGLVGYGTYVTTNGMFISLWIGQDVVLSQSVIMLLGLSAFAFSMNRLFRSLLFGFDELKFATNSVLMEALAYVVLSYLFIGIFGIITVPFVFLIVSGFFAVRLWNKIATIADIEVAISKIMKYLLMVSIILVVVFAMQNILNEISWLMFVVKVGVTILGIMIIELLFNYKYFKKKEIKFGN
jgi:O-antigen/teichoic acid export membrane protein